MKEFTDRVNATLPLDQPDYVQLTLIQSHSDKVCGACPAGQSLSASGCCVGLPHHGADGHRDAEGTCVANGVGEAQQGLHRRRCRY